MVLGRLGFGHLSLLTSPMMCSEGVVMAVLFCGVISIGGTWAREGSVGVYKD